MSIGGSILVSSADVRIVSTRNRKSALHPRRRLSYNTRDLGKDCRMNVTGIVLSGICELISPILTTTWQPGVQQVLDEPEHDYVTL